MTESVYPAFNLTTGVAWFRTSAVARSGSSSTGCAGGTVSKAGAAIDLPRKGGVTLVSAVLSFEVNASVAVFVGSSCTPTSSSVHAYCDAQAVYNITVGAFVYDKTAGVDYNLTRGGFAQIRSLYDDQIDCYAGTCVRNTTPTSGSSHLTVAGNATFYFAIPGGTIQSHRYVLSLQIDASILAAVMPYSATQSHGYAMTSLNAFDAYHGKNQFRLDSISES